MSDISAPIRDAETIIAARKASRESTQADFRSPLALEAIADEVTRLHAEMRVIRYLLAGMAAKP